MENIHSKRKYTVTCKLRTSRRLKLRKARAVGNKVLYRPTDKGLDACRANLTKGRESMARVQGVGQGSALNGNGSGPCPAGQ
jgi:hypothetical protein